MFNLALRATIILVLSWFCFSAGWAQSVDKSVIEGVESRRVAIESIAGTIDMEGEKDLLALRESLRALRLEASIAARPLREMRDQIQSDIDRLGPLPEEKSQESETIAQLRQTLSKDFTVVDDAIRQSELNISRSSRLLDTVSSLRRDTFYSNIFSHGVTPFSKSAWSASIESFNEGRVRLLGNLKNAQMIRQEAGKTDGAAVIMWSLFLLLGLAVSSSVWLNKKARLSVSKTDANKSSRILFSGAKTGAFVLPAVIAISLFYLLLKNLGYTPESLGRLPISIWLGAIGVLVIAGTTKAALSPSDESWRQIPVTNKSATRIVILAVGAALLLAADTILNAGANALGATSELTELQSIIVSVIGGILLFLSTQKSLWASEIEKGQNYSKWKILRLTLLVISVFVILAPLFGYGALGRFIVTRIFFLAALFITAWFIRNISQEGIKWARSLFLTKAKASGQPADEKLFFFWFGLIADIAVFAAALPFLLVILGMEQVEVRDFITDAFNGFDIGPLTISLSDIVMAIVTFLVILFLTRFIQRGLDSRVFAPAKFDDGVRNSFRTLLGYTGIVIAVLAALGVMGLKFANLAIIAGALSIGIGFGLQSIVNNFVFGLILLFERPIKVGDWVVVASGEGFVKNISVRSTEIETFDRASVIVPNSELISSSVKNWTHKDKYSRIIIPVGAAYKEDPKQIFEILERLMAENARVMKFPEPVVYFSGFGASSLDFEMRIFIRKPDDRMMVQNELRLGVYEAFKEAGIEIPFPQQDIYVRSLPENEGDKS